jgi:hypothetical protein
MHLRARQGAAGVLSQNRRRCDVVVCGHAVGGNDEAIRHVMIIVHGKSPTPPSIREVHRTCTAETAKEFVDTGAWRLRRWPARPPLADPPAKRPLTAARPKGGDGRCGGVENLRGAQPGKADP